MAGNNHGVGVAVAGVQLTLAGALSAFGVESVTLDPNAGGAGIGGWSVELKADITNESGKGSPSVQHWNILPSVVSDPAMTATTVSARVVCTPTQAPAAGHGITFKVYMVKDSAGTPLDSAGVAAEIGTADWSVLVSVIEMGAATILLGGAHGGHPGKRDRSGERAARYEHRG